MEQLAQKAGISRGYVQKIKAGKGVGKDTALKLAEILGGLPSEYLYADSENATVQLREVPLLGDIPAGEPCNLEHYDHTQPESLIPWASAPGGAVCFRVRDQSYSMNNLAAPGMLLLLDPAQSDPAALHGKPVIANLNGECTFKRYFHTPHPRLEPDSTFKDYQTTPITADMTFHIIGRVIAVQQKLD